MAAAGESIVAKARNFGFHAPHVGHDRTNFEIRCDLARERNDAIDGSGDDDELSAPNRGLRRFSYGVTKRLIVQRQPSFRAAGPEHDPVGDAARSRSARDRTAEKSWG